MNNKFKSIKHESLYNFEYLDIWNKIKNNLIQIWIFHFIFVIGILINILATLVLVSIIVEIKTINLSIAIPIYIAFRLLAIILIMGQIFYQYKFICKSLFQEKPIIYFFDTKALIYRGKLSLILGISLFFIPYLFLIIPYFIFIIPLQNKFKKFVNHKYYNSYISYYEKKLKLSC